MRDDQRRALHTATTQRLFERQRGRHAFMMFITTVSAPSRAGPNVCEVWLIEPLLGLQYDAKEVDASQRINGETRVM